MWWYLLSCHKIGNCEDLLFSRVCLTASAQIYLLRCLLSSCLIAFYCVLFCCCNFILILFTFCLHHWMYFIYSFSLALLWCGELSVLLSSCNPFVQWKGALFDRETCNCKQTFQVHVHQISVLRTRQLSSLVWNQNLTPNPQICPVTGLSSLVMMKNMHKVLGLQSLFAHIYLSPKLSCQLFPLFIAVIVHWMNIQWWYIRSVRVFQFGC